MQFAARKILLFLIFILSILITFIFSRASAEQNQADSAIAQPSAEKFISETDSSSLPDSLLQIDTLLIARKSNYRMKLYYKGKFIHEYIIALGQDPVGPKLQQGDNKTPEGVYKIIQKSRGPFEGGYSQYLGVAWMRINYPNNADAIRGFKKGWITEQQKSSIIASNNSGKEPMKTTKLGGGIGIHGWWNKWPGNDQQNLTWGCISLQNVDLDDLYKRIPVGTEIIILP